MKRREDLFNFFSKEETNSFHLESTPILQKKEKTELFNKIFPNIFQYL